MASAYFADEDMGKPSDLDDFPHTESIHLVDRARHLRGIDNGLKKGAVQQLIVDAQILMAEALLQSLPSSSPRDCPLRAYESILPLTSAPGEPQPHGNL